MRFVLMLSGLVCAIGIWVLPSPASAVSTTLDVKTPQGSKRADFSVGPATVSDTFEVSGTLNVAVNLASSPLASTLEIMAADLHLTDMTFDFGTTGWIQTRDFVATISTSVLTAFAFDGINTYSFDLAGADFRIISGFAYHATGGFGPVEENIAQNVLDLDFDPGAIAQLMVTGGSVLDLDLVLPLDASGTNVGGVGSTELRFSEQELTMTGTVVPEPGTLSLVAFGLAVVSVLRRHRSRQLWP